MITLNKTFWKADCWEALAIGAKALFIQRWNSTRWHIIFGELGTTDAWIAASGVGRSRCVSLRFESGCSWLVVPGCKDVPCAPESEWRVMLAESADLPYLSSVSVGATKKVTAKVNNRRHNVEYLIFTGSDRRFQFIYFYLISCDQEARFFKIKKLTSAITVIAKSPIR